MGIQPCCAPPAFEAGRSLRMMTNDLDELANACPHWDVDIMRTQPGALSSSLILVQGGLVQLGYGKFTGAFRCYGAIPRDCVTLVIGDGQTPLISHGRPLATLDVEVMNAVNGCDFSILGKSNALAVTVRKDFFNTIALSLCGQQVQVSRRTGRLGMISSQDKQHVRQRLRSNLRAAMCWPSILGSPRTRELWERAVVRDVLDASIPKGLPPPLPQRSRLAARAENYMRANAFMPMSIVELAAAVGASERALHLGFLERFGLTPAAYLKAARLHGARRDLRDACQGTTVTDIALRWGFFHIGRFAIDYRAFFEESPSATLARTVGTDQAVARQEQAIASLCRNTA